MTKKEMRECFEKAFSSLKFEDWGVIILAAGNGFIVRTLPDGDLESFGGNPNKRDDAEAALQLLWFLLDYFNVNPSRYAKERVMVALEAGDKYEPRENEKEVKEYYYVVVNKNEPRKD